MVSKYSEQLISNRMLQGKQLILRMISDHVASMSRLPEAL
jgi:hypothetical protein